MLLLLEMPSAGTVLLGIVIAILAALNGVQLWQRESKQRLLGEVEKWKTAADVGAKTVDFARSELQLVRDRCERLEEANAEQQKEVAVLRSRTDLESLKAQTTNIEKLLIAQDAQQTERHDAQIKTLSAIASTMREMHQSFVERDEQYGSLIQAQSNVIASLQSQVNLKAAMPTRT